MNQPKATYIMTTQNVQFALAKLCEFCELLPQSLEISNHDFSDEAVDPHQPTVITRLHKVKKRLNLSEIKE